MCGFAEEGRGGQALSGLGMETGAPAALSPRAFFWGKSTKLSDLSGHSRAQRGLAYGGPNPVACWLSCCFSVSLGQLSIPFL